jgi:hydrogenase nickel incorporation protein HypA/HybF
VHELSIAQSIIDIVLQHLPEEVDGEVRSVKVRLGRLSGVVPQSLDFCFSSIVDETPLRGARLEIEPVPVRAECLTCGDAFTREDDAVYICPQCRGTEIRFITGTELQVAEVTLEDGEDGNP